MISMQRKRVAALYDIHGNLPALDAVLDEVRAAEVDCIVIGGDVVPGPMAAECLARLRALAPAPRYIRGNCETEVLTIADGGAVSKLPDSAIATLRWTADHLGNAERDRIRAWPETTAIDVDGVGRALFCHATPRSQTEIFTRLTPEERLMPIFNDVDADVVVCGHTHMQFDRRVGRLRVVNAGSVGMPFGEAGAYWLLLGPGVELKRTSYDFEGAAARIRAADYPWAEDFAANNVLRPPSEAQVLESFGRAQV